MPGGLPEDTTRGTVGGGSAYVEEYDGGFCGPPDGAAVVRTRDELFDAVFAVSSGDTVYVAGDAEIDLTGARTLPVPNGVTLASDRGYDGAPGGLLSVDDYDGNYKLYLGPDATFTGLRLRGPHLEYFNPRDHGECRDDGEVDWYCRDVYGLEAKDAAVSNSELFGWTVALSAGGETRVHHNAIHHNPYESLGYGVYTGDAPLIEYNYFDYNRHSIAASYTTSYEARYNVVGPNWVGHQFDVHGAGNDGHLGGQAGVAVRIHHNTFQATSDLEAKTRNPGGDQFAVAIRGRPAEGAWIERNWFYHVGRISAVSQPGGDGNVHVADNHYGTDEPASCDVGAPRDGCP